MGGQTVGEKGISSSGKNIISTLKNVIAVNCFPERSYLIRPRRVGDEAELSVKHINLKAQLHSPPPTRHSKY
jgi:hypothetical protein